MLRRSLLVLVGLALSSSVLAGVIGCGKAANKAENAPPIAAGNMSSPEDAGNNAGG